MKQATSDLNLLPVDRWIAAWEEDLVDGGVFCGFSKEESIAAELTIKSFPEKLRFQSVRSGW